MTPLLSICIPTFNRVGLLRSCLASLAPQVSALAGRVELVVSDNASNDGTRDLVTELGLTTPLRYRRNPTNVGGVANAREAVFAAAGEYCWVLGDDDLARPGAVAAVVEALEREPRVDYLYVNFSVHVADRSDRAFVSPMDFSAWTVTGNPNTDDREIERWEQLVAEDEMALTPIYASVFRRRLWIDYGQDLGLGSPYARSDSTYPHAVLFARTLVGQPVRALGYPWVIMCGEESWSDFVPLVILRRFHDLLDQYAAHGVPPAYLERHRQRILEAAYDSLVRILGGDTPPGLETFTLRGFVRRHWRHRVTWTVTVRALWTALRQRARRPRLLVAIVRSVRAR
ncbi:MAG: glycosyltransferase family 2 protein [Gaiellaceae bacterium]